MKMLLHSLLALSLLSVAVPCFVPSASAEEKNWEYYSSILTKGMFPEKPKPKPTPPPPPPPPAPPPPNWKINYKVNMLYKQLRTGDMIVGVQNIKGPNGKPLNMTLKKGETHADEGITISDIVEEEDYTIVKITKDGITEDYELGRKSASPGSAPRAPTRTSTRPGSRPAPRISRSRPPTPTPSRFNRPSSKPQISGKNVEKHLQEYQMEVIRKGLPLLPVALDQSRIDQLKKEGLVTEGQDEKSNRRRR